MGRFLMKSPVASIFAGYTNTVNESD
jgi:hypothetical protein